MRLCGMLNSWWTGWSRSSRKSGGGHGGGSKRMVFRLADFKDWNAGLVLPNGARRHYRQDARRNGAAINVVKFPYIASRHVHSRKPRISKNGTPEERAAKAPVAEKRPYLGNPLRSKIVAVSGAATIAGLVNYQSHDLSRIGPIGEPHLQELRSAAEEARYLASEFERAAEQIAPSQRCGENHRSAKAAEDGPPLEFLQKLRTYV